MLKFDVGLLKFCECAVMHLLLCFCVELIRLLKFDDFAFELV